MPDAERLFRFLVALAEACREPHRTDTLNGVQAGFVNFRFLEARIDLRVTDVISSLVYLEENDFIRFETMGTHGFHWWLRVRLEDAA